MSVRCLRVKLASFASLCYIQGPAEVSCNEYLLFLLALGAEQHGFRSSCDPLSHMRQQAQRGWSVCSRTPTEDPVIVEIWWSRHSAVLGRVDFQVHLRPMSLHFEKTTEPKLTSML